MELSLLRAANDRRAASDRSDDLARVRTLLLDALDLLDRSPMHGAMTAASHVSHAVELLSPGADRFELTFGGKAPN